MSNRFQVSGTNAAARFTLKIHRGDGMCLLAMNWRPGRPPDDFVGFAIEYQEPQGDRFYALKNRLGFPGANSAVNPNKLSTRLSPIQKFRWVHFPRNAELEGAFVYRVTPVFMNAADELSYGEAQEARIQLRRETYPGRLNVTFTRGFVSSQAFVDKYGAASIPALLPPLAAKGLDFVASHPKAAEAHAWMGFEARSAILELLDQAIADPKAMVRVIAYDLNEPAIVTRLERLGGRLRIIIDDSADHGKPGSAESRAAKLLARTATEANVRRQHLGGLQHNKTLIVNGPTVKAVIGGSTNLSWRGIYVQNNNAIILRGAGPVRRFGEAFENFWASDAAADFGRTDSAAWRKLSLKGINAEINFSPRLENNAVLEAVAKDLRDGTTSSLFFSLAFLSITPGAIRDALKAITADKRVFCYGMADKQVKGLHGEKAGGVALQKPDGGKMTVIYPKELARNLPQPFKAEPTGGGGIRMHHKFLVIDFDLPTARVYTGSFNFSKAADTKNGENLLCIRNRRVATAYMIEALRIFDHYHFRVATAAAKQAGRKLLLAKPPRKPGESPWWLDDYTNDRKKLDRELFA
jgi:phosphatidylserine/phosphatidylglycerophosphate/cardiolipin synthase-like enzyme